MKSSALLPTPSSQQGRHARGQAAFTLAEVMTTMAIFSLVMIGVIYSHVFGLRMFNITATKLGASQGARSALDRVRDDIRSAKVLYVGNGDNTGFTNVTGTNPREGNALQIYPTASTNLFTRYDLDLSDQKLKRVDNGNGPPLVIAPYITNTVPFRAEDYAGNELTSDINDRVVHMTLDFYQWEFPVAQAGVGAFYDYYQLQTRMTRRTIE